MASASRASHASHLRPGASNRAPAAAAEGSPSRERQRLQRRYRARQAEGRRGFQ